MWKWQPGELPIEQDAPETVPSNEVTVMVPYGSLFFATAPLVEQQLPDLTEDTRHAGIIFSLRGEEDLGSTFLDVLERYAIDLQDHKSKLMLVGVGPRVKDQLNQTKIAQTIGRENIFMSTEKMGEAGIQAWDAGHKWLAEQQRLEALAEPPEEAVPEEPEESTTILEQVGKIGESATQAWGTTQEWIADQREDSDEAPPAETSEDQDEEQP